MAGRDDGAVAERRRVVVVGAGFGGLSVVHALRKAPVDIILIDRSNHHLFQPLLYQVATAALSPAEVAWPVRNLCREQRNVRVIMAEVSRVDLDGRRVRTNVGDYAYDQLVLAPGSRPSYFGHDDWALAAPGLKTLGDATAIRRRILLALERAETETDPARLARLFTFVVIGGGPTGVEMAGAVVELARETLRDDFRSLSPDAARVVLLEAGPRVLPGFPERLSAHAARGLKELGVEVRVSTPVESCDADGVSIPGGRIEAATIVWGAGVQASPLTAGLGVERDRAGRARTSPDFSLPNHPEVFVIGDAVAATDRKGRPVPGLASAAKQMGKYVGGVLAAPPGARHAPFRYRHEGDLATVGRNHAVVKLGLLELTGFAGWMFWSAVHIYFLIGLRNRIAVAMDWAWGYVTNRRGARLIVGGGYEPAGPDGPRPTRRPEAAAHDGPEPSEPREPSAPPLSPHAP
jgi:NADH dehydrogenase